MADVTASLLRFNAIISGDEKEIEIQEKRIYKVAAEFGGVPAGEKNGERGYTLTFVIAYIRDIALDFCIVAESFETSVPWDRALPLCRNVKHRSVSNFSNLVILAILAILAILEIPEIPEI